MENDNGRQRFGIELDTAGLMQGADAARNAFRGISEEAVKSGATMDSAMSQASRTASREAGVIEASFKAAYREAGNMPLSEIKNSINQQITYIKGLELKYKDVSSTIQSLPFSPKRTALEGDLKSVRQELDAEKAALDGLKAKYAEMSEGSLVTFRTQIMNAKNELMAMRLAGEQNTEAYKELEKELARLATIQREVNQSTLADSTGATQWNGIIQGLQGLMGAYSVGSGIVGMFTKDQEKLMQIQTKMQSVMGILMGMQTIANTLHSTSTFRLRTLTAATNLWHAANAKAAAGLRALGVSATVANVASKALMATMSMGLTVVIGLVVSGLSKLIDKHQETKRAAAESAKAQREAFEGFAKSAGEKASDTLSKFESLRQQYVRLGNDLKTREQFVKNNAAAFKELGVQVLDVHAADNLFINNTEAFKSAVMIRAQALAGEELAAEKYKEALQQRVAAEGMMWRASGDTARYAGLSDRQEKQAQEVYREAYAKYMEANYTSQLGGRNVIERGALTARRKEFEQEAQKAGNAAVKSYIDGLKKGLADNAAGMEEAGNRLISASMNMSESAREQLRKAGIREADGINPKKAVSASDKQASDLAKMKRDLTDKATQASIDAMEDGLEKELAQIRYDYGRKRDLIAEEEAKLKAAQGGVLSAEQASQFKVRYEAADAEYARAASSVEEEDRKKDVEALNDLLAKYADYEARRRQIAEQSEADIAALRARRTDENAAEIDRAIAQAERAEQDALKAVDEQFAQREASYQAWCEAVASLTLEQLEAVLKQAEEELEKLEKSGTADGKQIAVARAKVANAKSKVEKANAQNDVSPNKRSVKEWEDLYKVLNECNKSFEDIGDTVGGVAGEIISTAGGIMTSTLSMINGIVQLVNMSATGMQGTATAAATAISTVEKASVILTIISAAMQIAMQIVNLFNNDEKKQKEIEALQGRIDQLQWELDNADAVRLQQNSFKAMELLRQVTEEVRSEMVRLQLSVGNVWGAYRAMTSGISKNNKMLQQSVNKIADVYANLSYTADKALGSAKYDGAKDQLKNIAEQQLLIQDQIRTEESKKNTDQKKIEEWERKIQELGEQAVTVINEMVEDIIGGSAADIAEELGNAFIEAFQDGEDAAKAWGETVKDIVSDVMKRMLVKQFLEEPLGDIFDKYKSKWFNNGQFAGLDAVINSMQGFASDLNAVGADFADIWDTLPDSVKNMFTVTSDATREASQKGIATASQDTVDELNGRFTAIQGHTYDIREAVVAMAQRDSSIDLSGIKVNTDLLQTIDQNIAGVRDSMTMLVENNARTLEVLMGIETNTSRLANIETHAAYIHATLDDMAVKGIRIQ